MHASSSDSRTTPPGSLGPYRWAAPGDVNAFFGLILDNVVNLAILAGILIGAFGFPADVVYRKMFPGTALGVMIGDLAYTWLAFRLAKRTGRADVTAMPLGLDSPSTIGMAFAVLGPAFLAAKARMPENEAANSPSQPVLIPEGLYRGQLLHGDVTAGGIQRDFIEKVNGEY